MSQYFRIHPEHPQGRLVRQAVDIIRGGGVVAYPTDSAYALGCHLGDAVALRRIREIRRLDADHNFTLICRDLSEVSTYAVFGTPYFRQLKACTPGPYTFILRATREVPKRLLPKRKTIGVRIPDHRIVQELLSELGEPLLSTTLILPGDELPLSEPLKIRERLERQLDLVIDGGTCVPDPTTVVALIEDEPPRVLREGKGDPNPFRMDGVR